jgi:hypothetical protein
MCDEEEGTGVNRAAWLVLQLRLLPLFCSIFLRIRLLQSWAHVHDRLCMVRMAFFCMRRYEVARRAAAHGAQARRVLSSQFLDEGMKYLMKMGG